MRRALVLALLVLACDAPTTLDAPTSTAPGKCQGRGCRPDPVPTFPDPDSITLHPPNLTVQVGDSARFNVVVWWGQSSYLCVGQTARRAVTLGDRNGIRDVVAQSAETEPWPCALEVSPEDGTVASVELRLWDAVEGFFGAVGMRLAQAWGRFRA